MADIQAVNAIFDEVKQEMTAKIQSKLGYLLNNKRTADSIQEPHPVIKDLAANYSDEPEEIHILKKSKSETSKPDNNEYTNDTLKSQRAQRFGLNSDLSNSSTVRRRIILRHIRANDEMPKQLDMHFLSKDSNSVEPSSENIEDNIIGKIIQLYLQLITERLDSLASQYDCFKQILNIVKIAEQMLYGPNRSQYHFCMLLNKISQKIIDEINTIIGNPSVVSTHNLVTSIDIIVRHVRDLHIKNQIFNHRWVLKMLENQNIIMALLERYVSSIRDMIEVLAKIKENPNCMSRYNPTQATHRKDTINKYNICVFWAINGRCAKGDNCDYVHGKHELAALGY